MIDSDIIEGAFLKLTFDYRPEQEFFKQINKFTATKRDSALISYVSSKVEIVINDSIYRNIDFMCYNHPDSYRNVFLCYIPTENFKKGKNILLFGQSQTIPFWFSGK